MTRFVVVKGFQHPRDAAKKTARYAVVLGMVNGRVVVAPATTYPERHENIVHPGQVLLTDKSPAYAGSGFTASKISISIQDAGLFSLDSHYIKEITQVGILRLDRDNRLADQFRLMMQRYDLEHSPTYVEPEPEETEAQVS